VGGHARAAVSAAYDPAGEMAERPPQPAVEAGDARARRRERVLTALGVALFVVLSAVAVATKGVFLSRDWLFAWLLLGLLALSLTNVKRWIKGVFVDWLPFMVILIFYDASRFFSEWIGTQPHTFPQLRVDEILFGTPIPTLRLQQHLHTTAQAHWYDYAIFGVYMTHFFATLLIAALLWRFAYPKFKRYRTMVIALAGLGFVTYVLFPAVPPWMASRMDNLGHTWRIISDVWESMGLETAATVFEGNSGFYNRVAAVPSLHAAFPLLFMLFFWPTAKWWARIGLAAYALAMAFTLVYTAEHYVSDILLGWVYAVAVYFGVERVARWRERRAAARAGPDEAPARQPVPQPAFAQADDAKTPAGVGR
jgi:hypothetical protein